MSLQLHPIQIDILRELLFQPERRFKDLNPQHLPSDHLSFHIRRLLDLNLIQKNVSDLYCLTTEGKHFADTIDTRTFQVELQAKLTVAIICQRIRNSKIEYLWQQRLKHPYYGYWGCISGKIRKGESPEQSAIRELYEETGLFGSFKLVGIEHKLDYDSAHPHRLLADKYFFVFLVTGIKGNLITEFNEGKNAWLDQSQIDKLENPFPDMSNILKICQAPQLIYTEFHCQEEGY